MEPNMVFHMRWNAMISDVLSHAMMFREIRKIGVDELKGIINIVINADEINEAGQECFDRVKGNRPDNAGMSLENRILITEAVMRKALEIMEVPA